MNRLLKELNRRNVIKASLSYIALSWMFLEAADIIFPILGLTANQLKILLIALTVGFPVWVVFAYVFEWTPQGFRKTDEIAEEDSINQKTSHRLNRYIIAGLSIAVVLLVSDRLFNISGYAEVKNMERSIAVLPFENLSNDEDQNYFSEGLTDDILTQLTKIQKFRVLSKNATMAYHPSKYSITDFGSELGVNMILQGKVQKQGDQLRVSVTLVNTENGTNIWAESFDGSMEDLFQIQREVALSIAQLLRTSISSDEASELNKQPTNNIKAYQIYQQARYYINRPHFNKEEWLFAIDYLQEAIRHDSSFADAYALLTLCHSRLYFLKMDSTVAHKEFASNYAEKAIGLNNQDTKVKLALGYYNLWVQNDKLTALSYFEDALQKAPNDIDLLIALSRLYEAKGDWRNYMAVAEDAYIYHPLDLGTISNLGFGHFFIREFDSSIALFEKGNTIDPTADWNHIAIVLNLISKSGVSDDSWKNANRMNKNHSWFTFTQYIQFLHSKSYQAGIEFFENQPAGINNKSYFRTQSLAMAILQEGSGQPDLAKKNYERAVTEIEALLLTEPENDRFHSAYGLALSGVGRHQEAIAAATRATELLSLSKNAFYGIQPMVDLSLVYIKAGKHDKAFELLAGILSKPGHFHPKWVVNDYRFDPLKSDPRYQSLINTSLNF
ncbi:MAG: hypothetical protein JXQ90_05105 [Cyclobacteriaceae bacterium]